MKFIELRNLMVKSLEEYLGIPVVLSDQTAPVPEYPFCYYSVITSYAPTGEQGNYYNNSNPDGESVTSTRVEQPGATVSFTFCSVNRWTKDPETGIEKEPYIYGEDEAQNYAEMAQGFFLHVAYAELSNRGIVVVEVTNAANRTSLVVDEAARRWGFDVKIRYARADSRNDDTATTVTTTRVKE